MLPHWTQHDLVVHGIRIHYYRTGNGEKRPLVHGFSDNGLCWTPVARQLEADYDVIMPDMRAHGLSERVQPGDQVDMAADLTELIRALGLKRPIICGHSMGAMVTYQIGVRFPELASALVAFSPYPAARRGGGKPLRQMAEKPGEPNRGRTAGGLPQGSSHLARRTAAPNVRIEEAARHHHCRYHDPQDARSRNTLVGHTPQHYPSHAGLCRHPGTWRDRDP